MPCSPRTPHWSPSTLRASRRRYKSHDINLNSRWRFGATVEITKSPVTKRRSLEITTIWQSRRATYSIELRKLLFWILFISVMVLPATGLNVNPRARMIVQSGHAPLVRNAQQKVATLAAPAAMQLEGLEEGMLEESMLDNTVVNPLVEEISGLMVKESAAVGMIAPDDGTLLALISQAAHFVKEGDISLVAFRSVAMRACISAALHKVVGSVLASQVVTDFSACVLRSVHL